MELYALQGKLAEIRGLGANLVAISPQNAGLNAEVKTRHRLTYPVLTDQDNALARSLGLVYTLPADLIELYKSFGIDLPGSHGTSTWELPLATRMVVDGGGIIRAMDADPDYTIRPEPEATLEVLRQLA